jgi:hypothetical protein
MKGTIAFLATLLLTWATAQGQEVEPAEVEALPSPAVGSPNPAQADAPSAELINEAEETVATDPALPPGEEPLPALEGGQLPGEENIFGDDLFGPTDFYTPSMPTMPETPPMIEDPTELERKMRVKFRKLRARLQGDPQLLALKEMAERAPTPEDNRAARRSYYALFFNKVRTADSSMKDYADKLEKESVADLYQTRIEPTVALNPPPEPQPQAQFIPARQFPDLLPADEEPVALP